MSEQSSVKLPGVPSYWDKTNEVRVNLVDLGSHGHGFAAWVVDSSERKRLFLCVSPEFPRENRRELVHNMLGSLARKPVRMSADAKSTEAGAQ